MTSRVPPLGRLDRRVTRYRFDLDADIPWAELAAPGLFAGPHLSSRLGLSTPLAPDDAEALQWCFAIVTARAFVALEGDVTDFVTTAGASRPSRSATLLVEEEHKHRAMFQRFADALAARRPAWTAELDAVWRPPVSWSALVEKAEVAHEDERHWLVWLATLFFEEYTVWIHDALEADAALIQPAWLAAHECHDREEVQHALTDAAYLELLPVPEVERRRLAQAFLLYVEANVDRLLCLDVVASFMRARGVELFDSLRALTSIPLADELREHPAFERTRRFMRGLTRLPARPRTSSVAPSRETLVDHLVRAKGPIVFVERGREVVWTPEELFARARRRLAGLVARGLSRGDVVLVTSQGPAELLPTYWACLLGGLLPAPLDARSDRLETVRAALSPKLVVDDREAQRLDDASGDVEVSPGVVAALQLTSGSTSTPRAITLTHANVIADVRGMAAQRGGTERDVFVSWLPLFHDMGLVGFHLAPIILGAKQVLSTPEQFAKNPSVWLEALDRHRGTITGGPSSALGHLGRWAARHALDHVDLSSVHTWLVGAEPIAKALLDDTERLLAPAGLAPTALCPGYGLAEATLAVTMTPREPPRAVCYDRTTFTPGARPRRAADGEASAIALVDCGPPIPGVTVRITHEGRALPSGAIGHIEVSGPSVAGDPAPEWLDTGDLGLLDDGRLFVTGREKDTFFVDGRTFWAHDVERVAQELDVIRRESAVLLVDAPDARGVERRTLAVTPASKDRTTDVLRDVAAHVARRTGVPLDAVVAIPRAEIPRTTSGKVRRQTLRERFERGELVPSARFSAAGPGGAPPEIVGARTISLVREIWAAALGRPVDAVGVDDDFFALGGRSIVAADIHGRLEEALGVHLGPELLASGTTVRAMAAFLDARLAPATTREPEGRRTPPSPPRAPASRDVAVV
ncbi:non-ribosomal peptide synthetase, partial [Myxococcota bacterium]|nr:non-ribosomal peptide synthetase [Myxococcota bacterium]